MDGAWTTCCKWVEFKRGFDKRRPTCKTCLEACVYDETYATYGNMTYPIEERKKEENEK